MKYPKEEKRVALGYLRMYSGNIDTVNQITGITRRGVPGRSYPYPVDEEPSPTPAPHYVELRSLRTLLLQGAKEFAASIKADDPDIKRRALALSRIIGCIQRLDNVIREANQKSVLCFEYAYDGMVHNIPPWEQPGEEA